MRSKIFSQGCQPDAIHSRVVHPSFTNNNLPNLLNTGSVGVVIKDGATLAILHRCENIFCRNLKTNKVKYNKSIHFLKGNSQGIYLSVQIFG